MIDPLSPHADLRLYVPIRSSESALGAIAVSLRAGCSPVLVTGPSGIGKTLLLAVLADRERAAFARIRTCPRLVAEPEDLAAFLLLRLTGALPPRRADSAERALLDALCARNEGRTLLLVDDLQRVNELVLSKLVALARAARPALAFVAAGTSGVDLRARMPLLEAGFSVVLPESLPEVELAAIFDAILAHPGLAMRLRHRLEHSDRAEILCAAHGLPRGLKNELLRRNADVPPPPVPRAAPAIRVEAPPVVTAPAPALPVAQPRARRRPVRRAWSSVVWLARLARALVFESAHELFYSAARVATLLLVLAAAPFRGVRRAVVDLRARIAACAEHARSLTLGARRAVRVAASAPARALRNVSRAAWARALDLRVRTAAGVAAARERASEASARVAGVLATRARAVVTAPPRAVRHVSRRAQARALHMRVRTASRFAATRALASGTRRAVEIRAARSATTLRRGGRRALRAAQIAALPAAALLLAVGLHARPRPPVAPARPRAALVAAPAAQPVNVQVNARPWARIWIDGVDLGATPFQHRLAPGHYLLEAEFPNGRHIRRAIDVSAERRFVSLP
jgi:AAA domain-containing protein